MADNGILSFLSALRDNNSLEWMAAHKELQREASAEFEALVSGIMSDLSADEPGLRTLRARDLTFRLNRDTRFSHDKSPYRPAFRAHISPAGKIPIPVGYYLYIAPDTSFLGGGLYASQFPEATKLIREKVDKDGAEFLQLIDAPEFKENFTLTGEQLKNVPRGYDADRPQSEYLKYKSLALECRVEDVELDNLDSFRKTAVEKFLLMRPFNGFINEALKTFEFPKR